MRVYLRVYTARRLFKLQDKRCLRSQRKTHPDSVNMKIRARAHMYLRHLSLTEVVTLSHCYHNPGADAEKMQLPEIHSVLKDD